MYSNLALCYEKLDDITLFKETAIKCIEVDPNFIKGYYRLSKAFALSWQYDKQLNVLERGLTVESTNEDLLKMYKVAKHCSDHMNKFDKVTLEAPGGEESHLAYFGGGEVNNLPSDTVYASLERPTIPPIYKKYKCLNRYDDKIKPLMESFYKGTLTIKWYCPTNDSIEVDAYLPNETVPIISYKGKQQQFGFGNGFQTAQNKVYDKALSSKEKQHLCIVMMLRFLATNGSQLELNEQTTVDMIDGLIKMCTQHSLYHDIVYARIVVADIGYNKGHDLLLFKVVRVAEALEAAKRYQEAGEIYCEVTDASKYEQHPNAPATVLCNYAGLAFKRAQDYPNAEREYVTSLKLSGQNWGSQVQMGNVGFHFDMGDGNSVEDNLQNMLVFYEIAHRSVVCGFRDDEAHKRMQLANIILVALLYTAGYRKPGNTMFSDEKMAQKWQDELKPQYKDNAGEALNAVVHATMASSIDEYHQRLANCMLSDVYEFVSDHSQEEKSEMLEEFLADQKEKSKESSRDVMHGRVVL